MRTDALSGAYHTRSVVGRHFLQHLHRFMGFAVPDSDPRQTALLQQLGIAWRPRLTRLWSTDWQRNLTSPLILPGIVDTIPPVIEKLLS
jgi:hypothetical protein